MITVITQSGNTYHFRMHQTKTQITGRIVSLEADGEELESIKREFVNIPFTKSARTMIWKAEFARFIWENL